MVLADLSETDCGVELHHNEITDRELGGSYWGLKNGWKCVKGWHIQTTGNTIYQLRVKYKCVEVFS